jgi:hypothetical protein
MQQESQPQQPCHCITHQCNGKLYSKRTVDRHRREDKQKARADAEQFIAASEAELSTPAKRLFPTTVGEDAIQQEEGQRRGKRLHAEESDAGLGSSSRQMVQIISFTVCLLILGNNSG